MSGGTPIDLAREQGDEQIIALIKEAIADKEETNIKESPDGAKFIAACVAGRAKEVDDMVAADAELVRCRGAVREDHREFMKGQGADTGWTPLHMAAFYDQQEVVNILLKAGAAIDAVAENRLGNTPLIAAVFGGKEAVVRMLLKAGASVSMTDANGWTALRMATENGNNGMAKILREEERRQTSALSRAVSKGQVDAVGAILARNGGLAGQWKPIMDGAYRGRADAVRLLLEHGADPNVVSKTAHRYRPLHRAIEHKKTAAKNEGHDETVCLLLAHGADRTARGGWGMLTPVALAAMTGEPRFLRDLLKDGGEPDIGHAAVLADLDLVKKHLRRDPTKAVGKDQYEWQPILYAASSRMHWSDPSAADRLVKIAKLLIGAGARGDAYRCWQQANDNPWRLPALYYATGHANNPGLARVLLENGANPNDGESLFHSAEERYVECLELLLEYGGNLNDDTHQGACAVLWWVIKNGGTRSVRWLLEHGADPNLGNPERKETAFQAAVARGANNATLDLLVRYGGDLDLRLGKGPSARRIAVTDGRKRVLEWMASRE